jgi:hypothetical protein
MKLQLKQLVLGMLINVGVGALPAIAGDVEPYPLEYFALRAVVDNVTVSPDGKHVAMLKILSREGDPVLHVYETGDLDKRPFTVDADPAEIYSY